MQESLHQFIILFPCTLLFILIPIFGIADAGIAVCTQKIWWVGSRKIDPWITLVHLSFRPLLISSDADPWGRGEEMQSLTKFTEADV